MVRRDERTECEPFPVTSAAYVERLRKSVRPGGLIVIESFGEETKMRNRLQTAIDPGQLRAAFKEFRLLHFEDTIAMSDWGQRTRVLSVWWLKSCVKFPLEGIIFGPSRKIPGPNRTLDGDAQERRRAVNANAKVVRP